MIDGIPPEQKIAGAGGLVLMGIAILRWFGMRASKDVITIKADAADRDAFNRLQKRVNLLDERVIELEAAKSHLFGFIAKTMGYIAQCQCDPQHPPSRDDLQREFAKLIDELAGPRRHDNNEPAA